MLSATPAPLCQVRRGTEDGRRERGEGRVGGVGEQREGGRDILVED